MTGRFDWSRGAAEDSSGEGLDGLHKGQGDFAEPGRGEWMSQLVDRGNFWSPVTHMDPRWVTEASCVCLGTCGGCCAGPEGAGDRPPSLPSYDRRDRNPQIRSLPGEAPIHSKGGARTGKEARRYGSRRSKGRGEVTLDDLAIDLKYVIMEAFGIHRGDACEVKGGIDCPNPSDCPQTGGVCDLYADCGIKCSDGSPLTSDTWP